jgi:hypothetical protein
VHLWRGAGAEETSMPSDLWTPAAFRNTLGRADLTD